MPKMKVSHTDFPYAEHPFTKSADQLIEAVQQYLVRIYGEKPTRDVVLELCNRVLEHRK